MIYTESCKVIFGPLFFVLHFHCAIFWSTISCCFGVLLPSSFSGIRALAQYFQPLQVFDVLYACFDYFSLYFVVGFDMLLLCLVLMMKNKLIYTLNHKSSL